MWKLPPLLDHLRVRFMSSFRPTQQLLYDESMILYFGKHGCKQYIWGKSSRFGYMVWSLNTQHGSLVNFDIYQGKSVGSNTEYENKIGSCSALLEMFVDELSEDKRSLPYQFYFDKLFTSFDLL